MSQPLSTLELERESTLQRILEYPHELGFLIGKTKLTPLHSRWIRELWLPEETTFLQAHRGAYKTTSCVEIGMIWRWLFNPNLRIGLIRESWTVACATLDAIKKHMDNPALKHIFYLAHGQVPRALTKAKGHLLYDFKKVDTKENSGDAYGIAQIPTGSHYDILCMDDIVTINDRISKAKRESTKIALNECLNNILDPGCYARITGTPWHPDDAYESKTESGERILPSPMKYDCYSTGILTPEQIEKLKSRSTKSMFGANQLLTHIPDEGNIFQDPVYGAWDYRVPSQSVYGHIDAKYTGTDMGAVTVMARRPDGKIQARGWAFTEDVKVITNKVKSWIRLYRCTQIRCETNADKGYLARDLASGNTHSVAVTGYHEAMNKHIKIITYLKRYWPDIIWDPETDPLYMAMILDYREGEEPDDAPDSAASLIRDCIYTEDDASTDQFMGLYQTGGNDED